MSVVVKRAKPEHVDQIVDLAEVFWVQTRHHTKHGVIFNRKHVARLAEFLMSGHGIVQIALDDGQLVGMIALMLGPSPVNPGYIIASEVAFYVDPEYRKKGVGKVLLKQAEKVAKQQSVSLMSMVLLQHNSPGVAEEVYAKSGYDEIERVFVKEL